MALNWYFDDSTCRYYVKAGEEHKTQTIIDGKYKEVIKNAILEQKDSQSAFYTASEEQKDMAFYSAQKVKKSVFDYSL